MSRSWPLSSWFSLSTWSYSSCSPSDCLFRASAFVCAVFASSCFAAHSDSRIFTLFFKEVSSSVIPLPKLARLCQIEIGIWIRVSMILFYFSLKPMLTLLYAVEDGEGRTMWAKPGDQMAIPNHERYIDLDWSLFEGAIVGCLQTIEFISRTLGQHSEHVHEVHCSRERSRATWKIVEEYLMPFVEKEKYQISKACRVHPDNDMFQDQEQHKIHVDINEW